MNDNTYVNQIVYAWEDSYKKGLLTFWILLAIHNGPKYVRQIKTYIESDMATNFTVDEKSLYRSIARFKKMELIVEHDEPSTRGGPTLKVYELSPQGREALKLFYERNIKQIFLTKQFINETKGL